MNDKEIYENFMIYNNEIMEIKNSLKNRPSKDYIDKKCESFTGMLSKCSFMVIAAPIIVNLIMKGMSGNYSAGEIIGNIVAACIIAYFVGKILASIFKPLTLPIYKMKLNKDMRKYDVLEEKLREAEAKLKEFSRDLEQEG